MHDDNYWMQQAFLLAAKAESLGEVPVGAVVVIEDEVIAQGYNNPITTHDPTSHAEIEAIRAAGESLNNYRLCGTTLYVTLEPCVMCAGAIIHARIDRLVYGAADPKAGAAGSVFDLLPPDHRFNHKMEVVPGVMAQQCSAQLSNFFKRRRAENKKKSSQSSVGSLQQNK
ncbi:MAG: tRNA adenosine(34) deaminase TadA [Pseudomonadota bacterium]|nr:tRNA adenosine(34) deaminase TadA [Pseudomonadota bacterium]